MSYKEMNIYELVDEIERVRNQLKVNKNYYTQKQNKKYLLKLENEYRTYKKFRS